MIRCLREWNRMDDIYRVDQVLPQHAWFCYVKIQLFVSPCLSEGSQVENTELWKKQVDKSNIAENI